MDSARLQPALLGGVFIGVLSALPFISAGNCCCCMWVLAGGALAVYLRQQNSPVAVDAAEGMLLGLLAGVIGGVIAVPLQMAFGPMQANFMRRLIEGNNEVPPEMREMVERWALASGFALVGAIINVVISAVFGMLGGLLGVAIFKKNTPPPQPPYTPPPPAPYTPPSVPPPPTVIPHDPGTAQ